MRSSSSCRNSSAATPESKCATAAAIFSRPPLVSPSFATDKGITELLQTDARVAANVMLPSSEERRVKAASERSRRVFRFVDQLGHCSGHGDLPCSCSGCVLVYDVDQCAGCAGAALVRGRTGYQPRLPSAAHAPRIQDIQVVRIFSGCLRDLDSRGRADLLGFHASHPPSAFRSRGRSAHAA